MKKVNLGKFLLAAALVLSASSVMATEVEAGPALGCDDQQNDSKCKASAADPTRWTKLGPASNFWAPGGVKGYAMLNTKNSTTYENDYTWLFKNNDSGYYTPMVFLNSAKFVDNVYYSYQGNIMVFDQEYALEGWNDLSNITEYKDDWSYVLLERGSFY
ncbi:hypothetical protein, partial [Brevibacillus borstelensis]|uniref:hypothetical protein n=1 Tax=Brevibacillus borstelensis TaxID=45462 RepID=UPI0030BBE494